MAVTEAHALMCLLRAGPLRELLEKQPPQTNWRSRCFLTWLRAVLEFSLITLQYGQKASCLRLPLRLNDCLTSTGDGGSYTAGTPCRAYTELRRHDSYQARYARAWKS